MRVVVPFTVLLSILRPDICDRRIEVYMYARVGMYVLSLSNHMKYRSVFYLTSSSLDIDCID